MATYQELKSQIEALEREANSLRAAERSEKIVLARELVKTYGLTASELGLTGGRRSPSTAGVAKFRNPATGATWSGFGRKPQWLASAKDPESFRIGAPAVMPNKPSKKAAPIKKAAAKKAVPARKAAKKA